MNNSALFACNICFRHLYATQQNHKCDSVPAIETLAQSSASVPRLSSGLHRGWPKPCRLHRGRRLRPVGLLQRPPGVSRILPSQERHPEGLPGARRSVRLDDAKLRQAMRKGAGNPHRGTRGREAGRAVVMSGWRSETSLVTDDSKPRLLAHRCHSSGQRSRTNYTDRGPGCGVSGHLNRSGTGTSELHLRQVAQAETAREPRLASEVSVAAYRTLRRIENQLPVNLRSDYSWLVGSLEAVHPE